MKLKKHEPKVKPADYGEPSAAPEEVLEKVNANITCSYGIHRGNFPVAGMKIKDARAVLKKLMKVDNQAAAVINGRVITDEDTVISTETTLLSFVKPSAVKGAVATMSVTDKEAIAIAGRSVKLNGRKIGVDTFCGLVSQHTVSGLTDQPIPDNVKYLVRAGKLEVYIIELKPELRWIKWIADNSPAPYGSGAEYTQRKLATPYVVLKVPFLGGQLQSIVEVFYRNQPLASLDDKLFQTNLYNVSTSVSGMKNWFCTQYLNVSGLKGPADILTEVLNHVWGGGFNQSSEYNEGVSGFTLAQGKTGKYDTAFKGQKIDSRLTDVNKWEKESIKNPRFVLDIDWIDADATPRYLIETDLKRFHVAPAPDTSQALGNILLASKLLS